MKSPFALRYPLLLFPAFSLAAEAPTFSNVTTEILDRAIVPSVELETQRPFWIGTPDINGDGCLDIFGGSHSDSVPSSLWLHVREERKCTGHLVQIDNPSIDAKAKTGGWTQSSPVLPRCTARYQFVNLNNNPSNLPSIVCTDIDGSNGSALYSPHSAFLQGSMTPVYNLKSLGCTGVKTMCMPAEVTGDSAVELVTSSRTAPYNSGAVKKIGDIRLLFPFTNSQYSELLIVGDFTNDAVPEILSPGMRAYWKFEDGQQVRVDNAFSGGVPSASSSANHCGAQDFDSDGDQDLYCGVGLYDKDGPFTAYLFRNDNMAFTNVTEGSGLSGLLNTRYNSTYANTAFGDLDNDGYPDIVYFGESWGHTPTKPASQLVIMMNNGDMTFKQFRKHSFGSYTSSSTSGAKAWGALADLTLDGKLDIVKIQGESGPGWNGAGVWENQSTSPSRSITVRVASNTSDGLHTSISALHPTTGKLLTSSQLGVFSTGFSQMLAHLGVGELESVTLVVTRRDGQHTYENVPTNTQVSIDVNGGITFRALDAALID